MIPDGTIGIAFDQLPPAFQTLAFERAKERNGLPAIVGMLGESVVVHIIGENHDLHSVWITLANDNRSIIAEYNTLVIAGLFVQVFRGKAYLAVNMLSAFLKIPERKSAILHIAGNDKCAIHVSVDEEIGTITIGIVPKENNNEQLP